MDLKRNEKLWAEITERIEQMEGIDNIDCLPESAKTYVPSKTSAKFALLLLRHFDFSKDFCISIKYTSEHDNICIQEENANISSDLRWAETIFACLEKIQELLKQKPFDAHTAKQISILAETALRLESPTMQE